jgi:uncharacterized protein (DUF58 family)
MSEADLPGVQARLRRLELTVTRRLDGLLHGRFEGLIPGAGSELAGSREYRPGEDDARLLDWAVTARTGVPHVRETVADRELSVHVVVDGTASMDFGTADVEKRDLAAGAVAAVGFLTADAGNRLGASVLRPDRIRRIPPRAGRPHLLGVLNVLLDAPRAAPGAPGPGLAEALDGVVRTPMPRGLVVVVSDFLEPADGQPFAWERPLRRIAVRHQVLVVEVLDPRELTLPDVGVITLVDPETGRRRDVATSRSVRERYAAAAAGHRATVATAIRRAGAQHLQLRTDRDWVADIVRHVQAVRRARGAARAGAAR